MSDAQARVERRKRIRQIPERGFTRAERGPPSPRWDSTDSAAVEVVLLQKIQELEEIIRKDQENAKRGQRRGERLASALEEPEQEELGGSDSDQEPATFDPLNQGLRVLQEPREQSWVEAWATQASRATTPLATTLAVFVSLGVKAGWSTEELSLATSLIGAATAGPGAELGIRAAYALVKRDYDQRCQTDHLAEGFIQEREDDGDIGFESWEARRYDHSKGKADRHAQVRRLDSSGRVDWTWHTSAGSANLVIPPKGDVWRNRARVAAVLGQQAMVFVASLKGTRKCVEKVNVLRDSGATRNFIHPQEVLKRGLGVSRAPQALRVTLGDGKEVMCNQVVKIRLVFPQYVYNTSAYILDMGNNPDCTVILGTPRLATLGDYTSNEHKGSISFWQQGRRSPQ